MTAPTAAPVAAANQCAITQAPAVPEKPSTAPTDRSMPPEQITNVSPTASSSTSVAVLEVFSQLARVRKYGESMLNATQMRQQHPADPQVARRPAGSAQPQRRGGGRQPAGAGRLGVGPGSSLGPFPVLPR